MTDHQTNPDTLFKREPLISTKNLSVTAAGRSVFADLTVDFEPNSVTSIIGPSGIGKSTLLKAINALIHEEENYVVSGEILYKGVNIAKHFETSQNLRKNIGTVFQKPTVFPTSIANNVIFGVKHQGLRPHREFSKIIENSLISAGLFEEVKDRLTESAKSLSLGQKQRLSLARALAMNPDVILMDEPTSSLDVHSTKIIEVQIRELSKSKTIILVTHDMEQARRVSQNIVCLCPDSSKGAVCFSSASQQSGTNQVKAKSYTLAQFNRLDTSNIFSPTH